MAKGHTHMKTMRKEQLDALIGLGNGPRTMDYTWRDVALYALGVGAHKEDLIYLYEHAGMKPLPTFALTPYINAVNLAPRRRLPSTPANLVRDILANALEDESLGTLHMSMELWMHRPIDPLQGTFLCEDKVDRIYDRGEGKGIAVQTHMDICDAAGQAVCTMKGMHMIGACGGFGGPPIPVHAPEFPARAPDFVANDRMTETQHLLYRLSGDINHVHANPAMAQQRGFKDAFMQGLCSYGYACRMAIESFCPGEPERLAHTYAQMRTICYPDTNVQFVGWDMGAGKIHYRLLNSEGKAILDNGILEFKNA